MKKGLSQLVAILLMMAIAFACGFGGNLAANWASNKGLLPESFTRVSAEPQPAESAAVQNTPENTEETKKDPEQITVNVDGDMTVAEAVAQKVLPSVVGISTKYLYTSYINSFFGWGGNSQSYEATSIGTGFIVDERGYILTNAHVVNDGDFKSITVSLYDGETAEAEVLYTNPTLDLAVIKIDAEGMDLVAAELGDSEEVNIGSYAAAIGNPLGLAFERSMSQGIISGLNRAITVTNESTGGTTTMEGLMQTDATINSGNSGGPLLNSKGLVIGINSAKASNGEGMGFAIPINVAKPIVQQIISTGSYNRPLIGITGIGLEDQTSYTEEQLKDYFGTATGIYVYSLTEGGGAEAAGIQKGDIITEVNGTAVGTMNKLNTLLVQYDPGQTVTLTILRDGKEKTVDVVLTGDKSASLLEKDTEEHAQQAPEDDFDPDDMYEDQYGEEPEQREGRPGEGGFNGGQSGGRRP